MVLGNGLIDADGTRHKMLGLLDLETSFAQRKLHLGYRNLSAGQGPFAGKYSAHEFHYASTIRADGQPLFAVKDAENTDLGKQGLIKKNISGSFMHLIEKL